MKVKNTIFFILALGLFLGTVYAIQNVTEITEEGTGSFEAVGPADSSNIAGSNVTTLNLTVNATTEKWAGFKGNLSQILVLSDGPASTGLFYAWDLSEITAAGHLICTSTDSNYDWANVGNISIADLENTLGGVWDDDSADDTANTFDAEDCDIALLTITDTASVDTTNPTATTCAVNTTASSLAFCTYSINSTVNGYGFGVIVPVAAADDFYFYMELV